MYLLYHIARADFFQRVRSRSLLVVLAIVAYLGYLVNVGQIELAYQVTDGSVTTNVHGVNTAAFIGLKAGMTGGTIILLAGFYLMKNTLGRDRLYDVDQLVASTPVSDRTYLLGKWLSNIGLGVVILLTLGFATIVNHAIHGIGSTNPIPLLAPLLVFALPVCALVGAVALVFETVDRLNGTLGNILYFFLATLSLAAVAATTDSLSGGVPLYAKAVDILGHVAIYDLTAEALLAEVPNFSGGLPSFGTLEGGAETFFYDGRSWPLWIYLQRIGLFVPAVVTVLVAAISFDRTPSPESSDGSGWLGRLLTHVPIISRDDDDVALKETEPPSIESISLTPVTDRDTGGFWRLVAAEVRLAVRGQPWWWYGGAVILVGSPIIMLLNGATAGAARRIVLPLVFVWPIFVWSGMGTRTAKHRMTNLVLSSKYANRQLVAEWLAGIVVALCVSVGLLVL